MTNAENDWGGGATDSTKVVCKTKHGPVVGDSTEVSVLSVREPTVVDELGSDNGVLAALVGGTDSLVNLR